MRCACRPATARASASTCRPPTTRCACAPGRQRGPSGLVDFTHHGAALDAGQPLRHVSGRRHRRHERRGQRGNRGRRPQPQGRLGRGHAALDRRRDLGRELGGQGAGHHGERLDHRDRRVRRSGGRDHQRRRVRHQLEGVEPGSVDGQRRRALRRPDRRPRRLSHHHAQRRHPRQPRRGRPTPPCSCARSAATSAATSPSRCPTAWATATATSASTSRSGAGSARVELQSFQGDIHVAKRRAAEPRAGAPAPSRRAPSSDTTSRRGRASTSPSWAREWARELEPRRLELGPECAAPGQLAIGPAAHGPPVPPAATGATGAAGAAAAGHPPRP